jgi:hypothetical protein
MAGARRPDGPKHVVTFKATLDERSVTMQESFAIAGFQGQFSGKKH